MPRPRRTEITRVARYAERERTSFPGFVVLALASISASLVRLEGARGKEEEEDDGRNDVEDAPRVDDAPGEVVHVLEDVQIRKGVPHFGEGQEVPRDPDDEAAEDEDERENGGDDLVLRERRGERARGNEERSDERDPEVPRENRTEVEPSEAGEQKRVEPGRHEQEQEEAPGPRELGGDDGRLGHGRGQERLDGTGLAFLRQEAHRDDRRDEHQEIHWNTFVKNVDMRAIRGVSGELSAPTSTMNTHPLTSRNDVSTRYPSGETKYEKNSLLRIARNALTGAPPCPRPASTRPGRRRPTACRLRRPRPVSYTQLTL